MARWIFALALALGLTATVGVMAGGANPAITVSSPSQGQTIAGTTFTVHFQVSDLKIVPSSIPISEAGKHPEANHPGEGHIHFMLDLQPLVVWYQTGPYTFENVAPGDHMLAVELVNNDHSSLSPPVVQQIRFRTTGAQTMPATGGPRSAAPALALLGASGLVLMAGIALRRGRPRRRAG